MKKFKKLLALLLIMVVSLSVFAVAFAQETAEGVLVDDMGLQTSSGSFTTSEFSIPNSNDVNVYFRNDGTSAVRAILKKKGLLGNFNTVDSISVGAGKEDFKTMTGITKATYRIILTNSDGATIKGYLRARQLD